MSEKNFLRLFPSEEGYRMFLVDVPNRQQAAAISTVLEERLSDFGFDVVSTDERLANFHRVENTYLSTFQMLGGLGLALGTLGMAAVLLRNVFERRRELALLRAVGYNSSHFAAMVITENVLMLVLRSGGGICLRSARDCARALRARGPASKHLARSVTAGCSAFGRNRIARGHTGRVALTIAAGSPGGVIYRFK